VRALRDAQANIQSAQVDQAIFLEAAEQLEYFSDLLAVRRCVLTPCLEHAQQVPSNLMAALVSD
jgi:hypothetical protein